MLWHCVGYSNMNLQEVACVIRQTDRMLAEMSVMCNNTAQYISQKSKEIHDDDIMVGMENSEIFAEKFSTLAATLMSFQKDMEKLLEETEKEAQSKIEARDKEIENFGIFL